MNNQECKSRPQAVNVNGDEHVLFPFSIETSKYSGICIISTIRMQKIVYLML